MRDLDDIYDEIAVMEETGDINADEAEIQEMAEDYWLTLQAQEQSKKRIRGDQQRNSNESIFSILLFKLIKILFILAFIGYIIDLIKVPIAHFVWETAAAIGYDGSVDVLIAITMTLALVVFGLLILLVRRIIRYISQITKVRK